MSTKTRIGRGVTVALVVAVAAAVLAGCGSKASSLAATPTPSASPTASQGSLAQLGAAVTALPDAVKGLAKKPDGTWNASATRLKAISAQLSADAASLAALTPPDVLRPVQDAAVKAISDAQSAVTKTAVALDKGVAKRDATSAKIQSQIAALQGQLSQVGQRLLGAVEGMIASPNSTPTP
jgi:hypothetical protein